MFNYKATHKRIIYLNDGDNVEENVVHRRAAWKSSLEELSEATKVLGYTSLKIYLIVINIL